MSKSPTYFIKSFSSGKSQFKQIQITPAHTAATTTAGLVFGHPRRILSFSSVGVRGLEEGGGEIAPPTTDHTPTHLSKRFPRGDSLFPKKTSLYGLI